MAEPYMEQTKCGQDLVAETNQPIRKRLEHERTTHSNRISQIDEALQLLERNPDIERLMNLLDGHRW